MRGVFPFGCAQGQNDKVLGRDYVDASWRSRADFQAS
jgi:hypothetical protein